MRRIEEMAMFAFTFAFAFVTMGTLHASQNLIVNGDFEAGYLGFTSDYGFVPEPPVLIPDLDWCNQSTMHDPCTFTVGSDPYDWHLLWSSFGNHTPGGQKMMIINATSEICPELFERRVVWRCAQQVIPEAIYQFSFWVALSHPSSPPMLEVRINGEVIGTFDASVISETGEWTKVSMLWLANSDLAVIEIVDTDPVFHGDDWCLDDISLVRQPEIVPLCAGRHSPVGYVVVWGESGFLFVRYMVDEPWRLVETHLMIADSFEEIPHTRAGHPIPGRFDFGEIYNPPVYTAVYQIPIVSSIYYIAAHAVVVDGENLKDSETAWGDGCDGLQFPGRSWATYFTYQVEESEKR